MYKKIVLGLLFMAISFVSLAAADGTGTLRVFSDLDNVQVYVDNQLVGTAPVQKKDLKPGDYYVRAEKDGKQLIGKMVTIVAGESASLIVAEEAEEAAPTEEPEAKEESTGVAEEKATEQKVADQGIAEKLKGLSVDGYFGNSEYTLSTTTVSLKRTLNPATYLGAGVSYRLKNPLTMGSNQALWEVGYRASLTNVTYFSDTLGTTNIKQSPLFINYLAPLDGTFYWGLGLNYSNLVFSWTGGNFTDGSMIGAQLLIGLVADNYLVRLEYMLQNGDVGGAFTDKLSGLILTGSYKLF